MSIYNGKNYLGKSIKSVLNQTYTNYEFIIIDDASKDNSYELMTSYALKDNRIKKKGKDLNNFSNRHHICSLRRCNLHRTYNW